MSDTQDAFRAWIDTHKPRELSEVPMLKRRTIPIWTRRTIQEPVEPFFALYTDLGAILSEINHGVDDDFWEPSEHYLALDALHDRLEALAFREVPNPEYDPERAKDHWTHQTTMYIGQSYNPETPTT